MDPNLRICTAAWSVMPVQDRKNTHSNSKLTYNLERRKMIVCYNFLWKGNAS